MSQSIMADALENKLDELIEKWTAGVRDDPRIESDDKLSRPELIDHIPAIVEEICQLIRDDKTPDVRNSNEARANVYMRVHQGYKGRDLIRELSLLRITLLDYLTAFSEASPEIDSNQRHNAATILNLYLDEEMRYAISVYSNRSDAQ